MNLMLLLAQVAPALADSVAGANPVLTMNRDQYAQDRR